MRTVTSRKELIEGIEAGERHFKVKGRSLLLQCSIASKFNGVSNVTASMASNVVASAGAALAISGPVLIALSAIAVVGAIAIIAVLKGRKLRIIVRDSKGNEGEIEVF